MVVDHCLHVCSALDQDPDSCSGAFSGTSGHSQARSQAPGAGLIQEQHVDSTVIMGRPIDLSS